MIRIRRPKKVPKTLSLQKVVDAAARIEAIAKTRKPLSNEFVAHWGEQDVRKALWKMQHGKCCYCERKREVNRESDVEHFRPKADVTEAAPTHYGYWWLAYVWENLFFSCRYCNQEHKRNQFPVADEGKRACTAKCKLAEEDCYLIDPTAKNPEHHIGFDWRRVQLKRGAAPEPIVHAVGWSVYGVKTIDIVGLNKCGLPTERGAILEDLEGTALLMQAALVNNNAKLVKKYGEKIRAMTSAKMPFAAFRRDFFRKHRLEDYVADD